MPPNPTRALVSQAPHGVTIYSPTITRVDAELNRLQIIIISMTLLGSLSFAAQQEPEPRQNRETPDLDHSNRELERDVWERKQEEERRDSIMRKGKPPEIIPDGWIADYDYQSNLGAYLNLKHQQASAAGKNIYVYVYADWKEACKAFRKSLQGEDSGELFNNNEVLMLEYNFFARQFSTSFKNLPIIIRLHEKGGLGPESLHPVSNVNDHPRRSYVKLKKFLDSNKAVAQRSD